jgi:SAM-dependent methyltransferase
MSLLRNIFPKKINGFYKIKKLFKNKTGLEIGGPSDIFKRKKYIPVYPLSKRVDGVNFSTNTIWENTIIEGLNYKYDRTASPGYQYIKEGTDLNPIADSSYDFILSSHSLEHIANPIKALKEWLRVLKKGGTILAILPDKNFTFDHKRPVTTFDHLMDDYKNDTQENDLTHVDEIISLHNLDLDPGVVNRDEFPSRCLNNIDNRCLHHHVFDMCLLKEIFAYLGHEVVLTESSSNFNQIIIGIKN